MPKNAGQKKKARKIQKKHGLSYQSCLRIVRQRRDILRAKAMIDKLSKWEQEVWYRGLIIEEGRANSSGILVQETHAKFRKGHEGVWLCDLVMPRGLFEMAKLTGMGKMRQEARQQLIIGLQGIIDQTEQVIDRQLNS